MTALRKLKHSSFIENFWGNLLTVTIIVSLVLLIIMYFVQVFILT
jgi:hypothetical protein